jgi:3-hydroxyacyl-CoA dehydrogenase/3a,7a,12a-trihydroxy-5b-cholest-24-enoyl-CoA hydratase
VLNNAGVLGERMGIADVTDVKIDSVIATHLRGAFSVIRPAWRVMAEQGGGRIINTSSGTIFGIQSGASYQAAKAALLGLTRNLALQGAGIGIKVNALLPTAFSRMTNMIPQESFRQFMEDRFTPERVAQFAVLMASEGFTHSGEFFAVGGGRVARVVLGVTEGIISETSTAEDYADHLEEAMDLGGLEVPPDRATEFNLYVGRLGWDGHLEVSMGRTPIAT